MAVKNCEGCGAKINYEEIGDIRPGVRVTSVEEIPSLDSVLILKAINTSTESELPVLCQGNRDCAGKGLGKTSQG